MVAFLERIRLVISNPMNRLSISVAARVFVSDILVLFPKTFHIARPT